MYKDKEEGILSVEEKLEPQEEAGCCKSSNEKPAEKKANAFLIGAAMVSVSIFSLAMALVYTKNGGSQSLASGSLEETQSAADLAAYQEQIAPASGITLPVTWGSVGAKLTQSGVIDADRLKAVYADRGGMTPEMTQLLLGANNGKLKITPENSGYLLNLLWAFGLGQQSLVLDNGPMQDKQYGGAGQFASTGGWTMANGDAMSHYSKHNFVNLTDDQKALVERVAKNIYRPCCGNSTYFPDCNHGMAMLGLLELMASEGVSESDMYKAALAVNSYWFPDAYDVIAQYMQSQGTDWSRVDAKAILGESYSSGGGLRNVQAAVAQSQNQTSEPATGSGAAPRRSSGGCGV